MEKAGLPFEFKTSFHVAEAGHTREAEEGVRSGVSSAEYFNRK